MEKHPISRRNFLIASAASGAAALSTPYVSLGSKAAQETLPQEVKMTPTLCDGCGNWCAINVYTRGNRVWKVEGNPISGNNLGRVCAKGHALVHEIDNKDRIKQPLKRVGPNKFQPISWEKAYREIGERVGEIVDKHGPESLFLIQYPEGNEQLTKRFIKALGSPNVFSHGATCFLPRNIGWWLTVGESKPEHDFENARFIVFIGRNPAAGLHLRQLRDITLGRGRGARMVVVDPRFSEIAGMAQEWVRIRPGTDLALMLAVAHVIIKEDLYQKDFVANHTEGFDEFAAKVETCTPAWAEEKTSVPKDTIVTLARNLAQAAPRAIIHAGYHGAMGTQYRNSLQLVRAVACVNGLLGNFNQLGGMFPAPKPKLGTLDKEKHPAPPAPAASMIDGSGDADRYPLTPPGIGVAHAVPELALQGKLKGGFVYHNNPLRTNPNPARVIEGYRSLDLLVCFDYVLSETASIAHYVLPESHYLERDDVVHTSSSYKSKQVSLRQQTVKPLYDTKPMVQILIEMAPYLKLEKYFNFTLDEWNAAQLKPLDVDLDRLKKEGVIDVGGEWQPGDPKFKTPSGKLEFASSTLKEMNLPAVPEWEEPLVTPDKNDPHSFRLIHGKQAHQTHARTVNQQYLKEITAMNDWTRVWIHTERARALGIRDGQWMTISSEMGKGNARAKVTDAIHPDCVFVPSGYGVFSRNLHTAFGYGLSYNDFLPTYFDPVLGHVMCCEIVVRVEKS
jgi:thiosulfate reductase / polysulfide reductase chain A